MHRIFDFTFFDELIVAALSTGVPLEAVLLIVYMAALQAQLCGAWLIAKAFGAGVIEALWSVSIFSLGSGIAGPRLFMIEPECIPRQLGTALAVLALALYLHRHWRSCGFAIALGAAVHPLTIAPIIVAMLLCHKASTRAWFLAKTGVLTMGAVLGVVVVIGSGGVSVTQWHALNLRTPYVLVSRWRPEWILDYFILLAVAAVICWRARSLITSHCFGHQRYRFSCNHRLLPSAGHRKTGSHSSATAFASRVVALNAVCHLTAFARSSASQ